MLNYKIKSKHIKSCPAIRHTKERSWSHPWGVCIGMKFLDSLGRKNNGDHLWLLFNCNYPYCTAELLVKASSFLDKAPIK